MFYPVSSELRQQSYEYSTISFLVLFFTSDLNLEVLGTPRTIFRVDILDYALNRETEKQPLKTVGFSVGENV